MAESERQPTTERLAKALEEAGAPADMVEKARAGLYDDYKSDLGTPLIALVNDAARAGLQDIYRRAREGEFDAEPWEAKAWGQSPEGR
jgi:hypothetical protein